MKITLFVFLSCFIFNACSVKEINETVDSVTSDITNAFENAKDKSNQ
jgi:hypothetical protein